MEPISQKTETFAEVMKRHRKARKIRQDDLARITGASRAALSYYENGKRVPDIYTAADIAKALGFSLDEMVGIERQREKGPIIGVYRENLGEYRVVLGEEGRVILSAIKELGRGTP